MSVCLLIEIRPQTHQRAFQYGSEHIPAGVRLFPDKTEQQIAERWTYAVQACKEAIDLCHEASKELYYYRGSLRANPIIIKELDLRELLTDDWNNEDIWMNTQSGSYGYWSSRPDRTSIKLNPEQFPDIVIRGDYVYVPMKIADQFYTKHGLPVENDRERSGVDPTAIRRVSGDEVWKMKEDLRDNDAAVSGLVFTIARNLRKNLARDNARLTFVPEIRDPDDSESGEPSVPSDSLAVQPSGGMPSDMAYLRRRLTEAFSKLPPILREAYTLFQIGELSVREVAAQTGVSENLVKVRVYRAKEKLQVLLADLRVTF